MDTRSTKALRLDLIITAGGYGILAFLLLVGYWRFGSPYGFFLLYPWLLSVAANTGFRPDLAENLALAALLIAGFGWGFLALSPQFYPTATYVVLGCLACQLLFLLFGTTDRFAYLENGGPKTYYTIVHERYQVWHWKQPDYDALGNLAQKMAFLAAKEVLEQREIYPITNEPISASEITCPLSPLTGRVTFYYTERQGDYNFFLHNNQFDPRTGTRPELATPRVIAYVYAYQEALAEYAARRAAASTYQMVLIGVFVGFLLALLFISKIVTSLSPQAKGNLLAGSAALAAAPFISNAIEKAETKSTALVRKDE